MNDIVFVPVLRIFHWMKLSRRSVRSKFSFSTVGIFVDRFISGKMKAVILLARFYAVIKVIINLQLILFNKA